MKLKKLTAALCALAVTAALAACGGDTSDKDAPAEKDVTTTAATEKQTEKATEAKTEEAEETEATTTEAPAPVADPKYDYYSIIDKVHYLKPNCIIGAGCPFADGKIYFNNSGMYKTKGMICSYDINTKETADVYSIEYPTIYIEERSCFLAFDGKTIKKLSTDGTVIGEIKISDNNIQHNIYYDMYGDIINKVIGGEQLVQQYVGCIDDGGFRYYGYYIDPDFTSIDWFVDTDECITGEAHGSVETEHIRFERLFKTGGKTYGAAYLQENFMEELYVLDEEQNLWRKCEESDLPASEFLFADRDYSGINIYDLSKAELVCTLNIEFSNHEYIGENYHIKLNNGAWYKVQYPSDGSEPDFSKAEALGTESKYMENIGCIDETYYIVVDSYGVFLRTYEKGEAEEETIMMFS